jgi:Integrase core domain
MTWEGWAYLATVIDLSSRRVVGWALADHMRTELVEDALAMAFAQRRPVAGVIFHSDRGCQYQCHLDNFRECIHTYPLDDTPGFCGKLPGSRIAFR